MDVRNVREVEHNGTVPIAGEDRHVVPGVLVYIPPDDTH